MENLLIYIGLTFGVLLWGYFLAYIHALINIGPKRYKKGSIGDSQQQFLLKFKYSKRTILILNGFLIPFFLLGLLLVYFEVRITWFFCAPFIVVWIIAYLYTSMAILIAVYRSKEKGMKKEK